MSKTLLLVGCSALFFLTSQALAQIQSVPQVAVGGLATGLHFLTKITLFNGSGETISGKLEFFNDAGIPWLISADGGTPAATHDWSLANGKQSQIVLSSPDGQIMSGWVKVTPARAYLSVVFQLFDGNTLISEAGVFSSPAITSATAIYETRGDNTDTGVAISNPNSQPNVINLALLSRSGQRLDTATKMLPPNGHFSGFLSELFSAVPEADEMIGSVSVTGTLAFSAVSLRFDGSEFTTLPLLSGACDAPRRMTVLNEFGTSTEGWLVQEASRPCTLGDLQLRDGKLTFQVPDGNCAAIISSPFGNYNLSVCDEIRMLLRSDKDVVVAPFTQSQNFTFRDGGEPDQCFMGGEPFSPVTILKSSIVEASAADSYGIQIRPRTAGDGVATVEIEAVQCVRYPADFGQPQTQILPQIAVGGPTSGVNFKTTLYLANNSMATGSGTADILDDAGEPLAVDITEIGRGSTLDWSLGACQTVSFELTSESSIVRAGWLRLSQTGGVPVGVAAVFQLFANDRLQSEAGVLSASQLQSITAIHDSTGPDRDTGIAISNLTSRPASYTATIITYAADWSEYHHNSRLNTGGQQAQLNPELERPVYHLDPLWADPNINVVGIDSYFPLTESHTTDLEAIKQGFFSGRYYDWDPQLGPNVRIDPRVALKNLRWWWENDHFDTRANGARTKTEWTPKMKPFWLTEVGYESIHPTTVEPYVFPPSLPRGSTGEKDFAIQCLAYQAFAESLAKEEYIARWFAWNYDARPFPAFPEAREIWQDFTAWEKGHWIEGKWVGLPKCGQGR